jgi:hypothetical protein
LTTPDLQIATSVNNLRSASDWNERPRKLGDLRCVVATDEYFPIRNVQTRGAHLPYELFVPGAHRRFPSENGLVRRHNDHVIRH